MEEREEGGGGEGDGHSEDRVGPGGVGSCGVGGGGGVRTSVNCVRWASAPPCTEDSRLAPSCSLRSAPPSRQSCGGSSVSRLCEASSAVSVPWHACSSGSSGCRLASISSTDSPGLAKLSLGSCPGPPVASSSIVLQAGSPTPGDSGLCKPQRTKRSEAQRSAAGGMVEKRFAWMLST